MKECGGRTDGGMDGCIDSEPGRPPARELKSKMPPPSSSWHAAVEGVDWSWLWYGVNALPVLQQFYRRGRWMLWVIEPFMDPNLNRLRLRAVFLYLLELSVC